jgi:hypothetical protein
MATTETTVAIRATTTRSMTMIGARIAGRKVPYPCGDKIKIVDFV